MTMTEHNPGELVETKSQSMAFAEVARALGVAARRINCDVPAFRSPPREPERSRAIRHHPDGTCTVSVKLKGRNSQAWANDMIQGIVRINPAVQPETIRGHLWDEVGDLIDSFYP